MSAYPIYGNSMSDTAPGTEPTVGKPRWADDLQPSEITALIGGWLNHKVAPVPGPLRTAAKVTLGLAAAVAFLVVAEIVVAPFMMLAIGIGVGAAEAAAITFLGLGSYLALGDAHHQHRRAEYADYVAAVGRSAAELDGARLDLSDATDPAEPTAPEPSAPAVAEVQDTVTPEAAEPVVAAPGGEARRAAKRRMATHAAKASGTRAVPVTTEPVAPATPKVADRANRPTPTVRPEAGPALEPGPAPDAPPQSYVGRHSAAGPPSADTSLA